MSTDETKQDRIDRYLFGQDAPKERRAFERELAESAGLRRQLEETELAMAAIEVHEDAALKQRLRQLEAGLSTLHTDTGRDAGEKTAKVVQLPQKKRGNRTWLAIAATLLLLISAAWLLLRPTNLSPAQLAMAHFQPEDQIAVGFERGADNASTEAEAYRAYEDGNYLAAAAQFEVLPEDSSRSFYLGQSLLALERFAEAEPIYRDLSTVDFGFREESEYYLALSLIGQDKIAEGRAILSEITRVRDHPSEEQATELLAALEGR